MHINTPFSRGKLSSEKYMPQNLIILPQQYKIPSSYLFICLLIRKAGEAFLISKFLKPYGMKGGGET